MLVVYRGRHCPRCKRYLNKLNDMLSSWTDVMDVFVISADTKEKALAEVTALLVLKKKLDAFMEEKEGTTRKRNDE